MKHIVLLFSFVLITWSINASACPNLSGKYDRFSIKQSGCNRITFTFSHHNNTVTWNADGQFRAPQGDSIPNTTLEAFSFTQTEFVDKNIRYYPELQVSRYAKRVFKFNPGTKDILVTHSYYTYKGDEYSYSSYVAKRIK